MLTARLTLTAEAECLWLSAHRNYRRCPKFELGVLLATVLLLFITPISALAARNNSSVQVCKVALAKGLLKAGLQYDENGIKHPWTRPEKAIWSKLCDWRPFTHRDWELIEPKVANHEISALLLRAIVVSNYFDEPQFDIIHIDDATITGPLNLTHEILRSSLTVRNSHFLGAVNLSYLSTLHDVDFTNSEFCQGLEAKKLRVGGDVFIGRLAPDEKDPTLTRFTQSLCKGDNPHKGDPHKGDPHKGDPYVQDIDLSGARIEGSVGIREVNGNIFDLSSSQVTGTATLRDSTVSSLDIRSASMGSFELLGVTFRRGTSEDTPLMQGDLASIRHDLFLNRSILPGTVSLVDVDIGGNLSLRGATLEAVDMTGAHVARALEIGPTCDPNVKQVPCPPSAKLETKWGQSGGKMFLDHAAIGIFRVPKDAWPKELRLSGLTYAGFDAALTPDAKLPDEEAHVLSVKEALGWLKRAEPSAKQPSSDQFSSKQSSPEQPSPDMYDRLSEYFQKEGYPDRAKAVGYAEKNAELSTALYRVFIGSNDAYGVFGKSYTVDKAKQIGVQLTNGLNITTCTSDISSPLCSDILRKSSLIDLADITSSDINGQNLLSNISRAIFLSISWGSIGYGYYVYKGLIPLVIFTTTGATLLTLTQFNPIITGTIIPPINKLAYSFDMLLPIIRLREVHYQIDIDNDWVRRYFYVQRIIGFILGSLLAAGLTGFRP